jgi:NTE family protein
MRTLVASPPNRPTPVPDAHRWATRSRGADNYERRDIAVPRITEGMRIGLVLGAGGVMGGAWLTGGLAALADETGWDPGSADFIVGTSAGSMIGALVGCGVPPWFMVAHSAGETFDGLVGNDGQPAGSASRSAGAEFKLHRALPVLGPGSLSLIARTLGAPGRHTPAAFLAGWAPRGVISTDSLKEVVRRVVASGWSEHPNLWIVACDYRTGKRTVFGRADAPPADLADAVAASCAIPGFYRPVEIAGRRYVDGGVRSPSNLDVLGPEGLDLAICLNPTSSLHLSRSVNPAERAAQAIRGASGRRLGSEAKRLRAAGTEVALIQPMAEDLALMGRNLMATKRRHEVIELARETVAAQVRELGLPKLPRGEPHKLARPKGHPSTWPQITGTARAA